MSLGCAIIGGILFGPAGFVAGALVNNQKEKIVYVPVKKDETPVKVFGTNYVPMEEFMVNIDYFYENRKTIDFYAISSDKEDALAKLDILQEYEEYEDYDNRVFNGFEDVLSKMNKK